jgi:group I intron endonuclease
MNQPFGVCYRVTNQSSGRAYIGQTEKEDPQIRWLQHLKGAQTGDPKYLYNAIRKHGADNFTFEVIFSALDRAALNWAEDHFIATEDTLHPGGYNLKGGGAKGKWSDAMKAKLTATLAKPEVKDKISNALKKHYTDPKNRMRVSAQTKAALASPAARERLSAGLRDRWSDPEFKARTGAAISAALAQPEVKQKNRAAQKAVSARPEVKAVRSARTKASWTDPEVKAKRKAGIKLALARPDRA